MRKTFQHLWVKSTRKDADVLPSDDFPQGFLVFAEPEHAVFDLVFIHGLTGDRERTWTYPGAPAPWPKTLLPTQLPNARILTYGYDAYFLRRRSYVSSNRLRDHSKDFLNAFTTNRAAGSALGRPIVFVVHSLGGLLCKDMLLLSRSSPEQHLCDISEQTTAIAFMGTPHTGSVLAKWARIPASSLGVVGSINTSLLSVLETHSEVLSRIQEDFLSMLRRLEQAGRPIQITCFCETLPMPVVGQIVPQESASLPGYNSISLHTNHRDLVRYGGLSDSGFKLLLGEIKRWTFPAQQGTKHWPSSVGKRRLSPEERDVCLASLAFPEMTRRQDNIEQPNDATCVWILQDTSYKSWLSVEPQENRARLLWIKGKPGSGKSTLMKSLVSRHAWVPKGTKADVCLAFFFNARGATIERTLHGLYRGLLYQLLGQSDTLMQHFYLQFKQKGVFLNHTLQWDTGQLSGFLHEAISTYQEAAIHVFIDALDECEDDSVRQIVQQFEKSLAASTKNKVELRICWSSRHYPHISVADGIEVRMEDRNASDINLYIQQELCLPAEYDNARLTKLLIEKASGIFLWIVLVVRRLLKASDQGLEQAELEIFLHKIPSRLGDYFAEILDTLDSTYENKSSSLIKLVLCSFKPLRVAEAYAALGIDIEPAPQELEHVRKLLLPTKLELQRFGRLVNEFSGGLFEVVHFGGRHSRTDRTIQMDSTVQVIHETVRDFLLGDRGLQKFATSKDHQLLAASHEQSARMCGIWFALNEFHGFPTGVSTVDSSKIENITRRLCKPIFILPELLDHKFTYYAFDHLFGHIESSKTFQVTEGESGNMTEKKKFLRRAFEGWIFRYASHLLQNWWHMIVNDELIQHNLRFVAQRASMFLLTPSQLPVLATHLDKLKLCLTRLCPPYVPQGLNDFEIPGTLTYTTFYQICWPISLVPHTTMYSGLENTLRAIATHAFAVRIVIHPVSDIDRVLKTLGRQMSHLQIVAAGHNPEKQVWPGEVRMRDYKFLLNAEIPWSRVTAPIQLAEDFWSTYQDLHTISRNISLLFVEKSGTGIQSGGQLPTLELLNWCYGKEPESLWTGDAPKT